MKITILTLFPEMFNGFLSESIIKRAIDKGIVSFNIVDIRSYSHEKHHHVDDTPYGGGAGMVLKVDIVHEAIKNNSTPKSRVIMMTPQGKRFDQKMALDFSKSDELVFVCGHYEGFDERIRDYVNEEVSIGDFVLTGGELPSMVISDSVVRLLNGAIVKESFEEDSFYDGLLEYPQYTRPVTYEGKEVPSVLVNGNHELIRKFRLKESLRRTYNKRPDLLQDRNCTKEELIMLREIKEEEGK